MGKSEIRFLASLFLFVIGVGLLCGLSSKGQADESEPIETITYTVSTETHCNEEGTCWTALYSGTQHVYEDETWKHINDAKSLKGKGGFNIVYLEDDGTHEVEVIDFNMTYIELNFSYDEPNLGEYETEVDAGKMKTKYKIVETLYNETTGAPYQNETEYEIEIEEGKQESYIFNGNPFGKEFHLGNGSTTVQLQDNETDNLGDTFIKKTFPDSIYGSYAYMMVGESIDAGEQKNHIGIMFNHSGITQSIDSSTLSLYAFGNSMSSYYLNVFGLENLTWSEDTMKYNIGFEPVGDLITSFQPSGSNTWFNVDVTQWINNSINHSYDNSSFMLNCTGCVVGNDDRIRFYTKEYTTDVSLRPYLNITYSPASTCSCPGLATNWEIDPADYCIITLACNISTGNITHAANAGNTTYNATITTSGFAGPAHENHTIWIAPETLIQGYVV